MKSKLIMDISNLYFFYKICASLLLLLYVVEGTYGSAIQNEKALKNVLLEHMTLEEHYMFFGSLKKDPEFYLVKPIFTDYTLSDGTKVKRLSLVCGPNPMQWIVYPTEGLVSPHLDEGVFFVDGQPVPHRTFPEACHYRYSNNSIVVAVNDCHPGGLDGLIITPDEVGVLHRVPSRFTYILHSYFRRFKDPYAELFENPFDFHIYHVADKSSFQDPLSRFKRSATEEEEEEDNEEEEEEDNEDEEHIIGVCATNDDYDMTDEVSKWREEDERKSKSLKIPMIRSFAELLPDVQEDIDKFQNASIRNDQEDRDEVETLPLNVIRRKTIELAVFCDDVLYKNFPRNLKDTTSSKLNDYVLTIVNAIQGIYHQEELQGYVIDIVLVRLEIYTDGSGPRKSGGDIGAYLTTFCDWQKERNPTGDENPRHWDHAIMLSGLDLHSSGNPSVIGLAWVSGMCLPSISCTMNEGKSFMAVYVVAHEMGHNLGMNHDGQNDARGCDRNKFIMSPSVGPGKTTWSHCSIQVVHDYLRKSSCLDDGIFEGLSLSVDIAESSRTVKNSNNAVTAASTLSPFLQAFRDETPGHRFSLAEQCQAMYGIDYYPALTKFDLCEYLYCTNGFVTRPAHPALEGSPCGSNKICLGGKCRPQEEIAKFTQLYGAHVGKPTEDTGSVSNSNTSKVLPDVTLAETEEKDCTCFKPSPSLPNFPKKLCPFIAKAFHPMFDCDATCLDHDLYIHVENGKIYKIHDGMAIEELPDSCNPSGHHFSLMDELGLVSGLDITDDNPSLAVSEAVCEAVPLFLRPSLACPEMSTLLAKCFPKHIILAKGDHNLTYVPQRNELNTRHIQWQGKRYIPLNESVDFARDQSDAFSELPALQCDLGQGFEDILPELCQFLAPAVHPLFNCNQVQQGCLEHVLFVNLEDMVVTKAPVNFAIEHDNLVCDSCPQSLFDANNILVDLITEITANIALQSLCHLLPSSWLKLIPICSSQITSNLQDSDECFPNTIVVQGESFDFTYGLQKRTAVRLNPSSIEWKGRPYFMERIAFTSETDESLANLFNVDFSKKSMSIFSPRDLVTTPRARKYTSSLPKGQLPLQRSLNLSNLTKDQSANGKSELKNGSQNLQEYIGQRDLFLAINSGSAMLRSTVGPCSVTCGQGTRSIGAECVDVSTDEIVNKELCPGFTDADYVLEPCFLPPCSMPKWYIGSWGPCSENCGPGVQYREVSCVIDLRNTRNDRQIVGGAQLVVDNSQCKGRMAHRVRDCEGSCEIPVWCENEDCVEYHDVEISKDFDY